MAGVLSFDILAGHEPEGSAQTDEAAAGPAPRILCAACGHAVSDRSQRIEVGGAHAHRFTNPAGFAFEIGCFRTAGGCREVGEATGQWTWFAGFRWRIALCAGCTAHLGWSYGNGAGERFFGLILARLTEPS